MTILLALLIASGLGGLHALRGSGFFSKHIGTSTPVKWGLMPLLLAASAYFFGAPVWLAILFVVPYLAKMGTGTGGDMQASKLNYLPETFNPHEMRPFDNIAKWVANKLVWKYESLNYGGLLPTAAKWHQVWGFIYCLLWAFVFMIPFFFTHWYVAVSLLLYPVVVRHCKWRFVEFWLMSVYTFNFLLSLAV